MEYGRKVVHCEQIISENTREAAEDERFEKAKMLRRLMYTGANSMYCGIDVTRRSQHSDSPAGRRTEVPGIEGEETRQNVGPVYRA